jgi:hypothetical protein
VEREHKECKKCKTIFSYSPEDIWWDESGTGYSTKLCKCPECGCINVIQYNEDRSLDINNDRRFF